MRASEAAAGTPWRPPWEVPLARRRPAPAAAQVDAEAHWGSDSSAHAGSAGGNLKQLEGPIVSTADRCECIRTTGKRYWAAQAFGRKWSCMLAGIRHGRLLAGECIRWQGHDTERGGVCDSSWHLSFSPAPEDCPRSRTQTRHACGSGHACRRRASPAGREEGSGPRRGAVCMLLALSTSAASNDACPDTLAANASRQHVHLLLRCRQGPAGVCLLQCWPLTSLSCISCCSRPLAAAMVGCSSGSGSSHTRFRSKPARLQR